MYVIKTIFTLLSFIFLISSCQKNVGVLDFDSDNEQRIILNYSKSDSIEAIEFAIWLSGELEAPDSLVTELLYNLNYLRYKFGSAFPIVNDAGRFLPPWKLSQVSCKVDSTTARLINDDVYMGWDILPLSLHPDNIIQYPDNLGWCLIGFNEIYHPNRLSESYSTLLGFIICEPNRMDFAGLSGYPFFPAINNGTISYLYPYPAGMTQYYYYFESEGEEPRFIGMWDRINEAEPDWWPEARKNIEKFEEWDSHIFITYFNPGT